MSSDFARRAREKKMNLRDLAPMRQVSSSPVTLTEASNMCTCVWFRAVCVGVHWPPLPSGRPTAALENIFACSASLKAAAKLFCGDFSQSGFLSRMRWHLPDPVANLARFMRVCLLWAGLAKSCFARSGNQMKRQGWELRACVISNGHHRNACEIYCCWALSMKNVWFWVLPWTLFKII